MSNFYLKPLKKMFYIILFIIVGLFKTSKDLRCLLHCRMRCLCVCVRAMESYKHTVDACLFGASQRRIRLVGSVCTDWAGASLRSAHSSNQAGCQTNRWSQQRDVSLCLLRCDCNRCNADTNAWHSVTAYCVYTAGSTLTYFEGGWWSGGWHCAHMITHKIMFVSSNGDVTM